jgi:hypothetical protein
MAQQATEVLLNHEVLVLLFERFEVFEVFAEFKSEENPQFLGWIGGGRCVGCEIATCRAFFAVDGEFLDACAQFRVSEFQLLVEAIELFNGRVTGNGGGFFRPAVLFFILPLAELSLGGKEFGFESLSVRLDLSECLL